MRVVLDTNILVRAARAGSPAREVFDLLLYSPHALIGSRFILDELARVMRYPRLQRVHGLSDAEIDRHVQDVEIAVSVVDLPQDPTAVVTADPADDPIVSTAMHGNADVICTLDRHFRTTDVLAHCAKSGVRVLTDIELLAELRALP